jgi:YVTN family beta-propeller protein
MANNNPTKVAFIGTAFQATPEVFLGTPSDPEKYELNPVFVDPTRLEAIVPVNLLSGAYQVKVRNPDGLSGVLPNGFFIGPPLQRITMWVTNEHDDYYQPDGVSVVDLEQQITLPTIPLTQYDDPTDIAVHRPSSKGVVTMYGTGPSGERGKVGIYHLGLGQITRTLNVPDYAQAWRAINVEIAPDGKAAYVETHQCCVGSLQRISKLDMESSSFTSTISIGNWDAGFSDIEISPDGATLYATNSGDDTVSVVRLSDFTEIAEIPVGDGPAGLAVAPNGKTFAVTNFHDETVAVVNVTTQQVTLVVDVSYTPFPTIPAWPSDLVYSPDGTKLFVAFLNGWRLATIDLTTGQMIDTLDGGFQYERVTYVRSLDRLFSLAFTGQITRYDPANLNVEWMQDVAGLAFGFDYADPEKLTIASVVPNRSCVSGGIPVTIKGSGFQGEILDQNQVVVQEGTTVHFGGTEATSVTLVNSKELTVVVPPHTPGFVNVVVANPNGQSATLVSGFAYRLCP